MNDETVLPQDLTPKAYLIAGELSRAQAAAIERAIDFWFKDTIWDEVTLAELGCITHHQGTGEEAFSMNGIDLVRFGAAVSKIEIEGNHVTLRYSMEIEEIWQSLA